MKNNKTEYIPFRCEPEQAADIQNDLLCARYGRSMILRELIAEYMKSTALREKIENSIKAAEDESL